MSHASTFPCSWCDAQAPWQKEGRLRTLGDLRRLAEAFQAAGGDRTKAKHFKSVVNQPLLAGPDDALILDLAPPPELHLLLGATNRIFDSLNQAWGENRAFLWAHGRSIVRAAYRGGSLEGPACKKLLLQVGLLTQQLPLHLKKYGFALNHLNEVRLACFGPKLDETGFKRKLGKFKEAYLQLGVAVTPKLHCIFTHVDQFCSKTGKSLGPLSEQAVESLHHDFAQTWARYAMPPQHPQFGERLLQATINYNSFHLQ